ncbi:MAG: NADPH-dependent FMN reductase [Patescibacteria group bacterium]
MTNKLNIPIIIGTGRDGNYTSLAATAVLDHSRTFGFDSFPVEVTNYVEGVTGQSAKKDDWNKLLATADGLLIVTPEYNHGYPGELKLALDLTQITNSLHKPVGLIGVSSGGIGGSRVVENLKPVCLELGLLPLRSAVYFSEVNKIWPERQLEAIPEKTNSSLLAMLTEMETLLKKLS